MAAGRDENLALKWPSAAYLLCKDNANERNESLALKLPSAAYLMQR